METCAQCGIEFQPELTRQKYHSPACAAEAAHQKGKERDDKRAADRARWRAEYRNTPPPVQPAVRRVPTLRARTLAETPDLPCDTAARGDMLTGAAPAANHGASVGLVSVGV